MTQDLDDLASEEFCEVVRFRHTGHSAKSVIGPIY